MSLHDEIVDALPQLRAAAESLMTDMVEIRRNTSNKVDSETGLVISSYKTIYKGRGKVQSVGSQETETVLASGGSTSLGGKIPSWQIRLDLPYGTDSVNMNDEAIIIDSVNLGLVGRKFRLMNWQSEKTYPTADRWWVQETV